ncbi:VPS4-associated protein 1 [Daedaleopsis nitida]|nr:VPS4-associated protein 1 [Daedaleopsis nitida]
MASAFTNLYYKRAVGTAKPCYVCNKPTTTVLATINTVDFLYTCDTHLADPGFASQVGTTDDGVGAGGAKKMGLSPEEIAKVKAEWEDRQKKKAEKAKENEADKDKGKEGTDQDKEAKDKKATSPSPGAWSPPTASASPAPATPTHQRYTLHRDIFALRLAEHRRRRQAAQAKELAPRLPGVPMSSP